MFPPRLFNIIFVALLAFLLAGCFDEIASPEDEQKETYYITGTKHLRNRDYESAREMFEKALEANPRSASAHLELGVLNDQHFSNYVTAIYHYQKHLKLRPQSHMAEAVRQRVNSCQLEMAKAGTLTLASREVQRDLDRLHQENALLKRQVEALKVQLATKPLVITNYIQAPSPAAVESPRAAAPVVREADPPQRPEPRIRRPTTPAPTRTATPRIYIVRPGETMAAIARRYNLTPAAVQAANPGVDARRMRPGTRLKIPVR